MKPDSEYFQLAADQAKQATCHRARCGSVIVSRDGRVIGVGSNNPPAGKESERYCDATLDSTKKPHYDTTCCVHAEWNAILNAMATESGALLGATLYFMRIDNNGDFTDAGEPFCTVCSRLALQSGLDRFMLWNNNAPQAFDTTRYNQRTYQLFTNVRTA